MCGRLALESTDEIAKAFFTQEELAGAFHRIEQGFNLAPGMDLSVIVENRAGGLEIRKMHWGLKRPWSRSDTKPPSNARAETIQRLPTFRDLLPGKRCLVPMTGYYEWRVEGGRKTPYFILPRDRPLCCFAGLYDAWRLPDGSIAESYCIITTTPADSISFIHDRMPVIIRPGEERRWLSRDMRDVRVVIDLLKPYPSELLTAWPVSSKVNNTRNDGPELVLPVDAPPTRPEWAMEPLIAV